MVKLIECPRDAMQGIKEFIPTEQKAKYLNKLLKCGFHTIDFGSFVSPKWVPQLKDTADVLEKLELTQDSPHLLSIAANLRGAKDACQFEEIKYLGFPFSISETFQQRNINATLHESLGRVEDIQIVNNLCAQHDKKLIVYISMAFGNPYNDPWNMDLIYKWIDELINMDVEIAALSDTVGVSNYDSIVTIFADIIREFPEIEFGAHFHTTPQTWEEKVAAAYEAGCKRFDGAIKGFGGCPMAAHELVGNMPQENLLHYFNDRGITTGVDMDCFREAFFTATEVFPSK